LEDGFEPAPNQPWGYVAGTFPNFFVEKCNLVDFDNKVMMYNSCEDGNLITGDGCDGATCEVEYGYECGEGDPIEWDTCKEICGDGHDLGNYECDDGNINTGDGCDRHCHIEKGYTCV
jgi:cysteine-rich repeat protein